MTSPNRLAVLAAVAAVAALAAAGQAAAQTEPPAATPLTGTEVIKCIQGGAARACTPPMLSRVTTLGDLGAVGDGQLFAGCSMTAGSNVLTCPGAGFTSALVTAPQKLAAVRGAGASGGDLITTVAGYTDSTHLTLAANAATTTSGLYWQQAIIGTDNASAFATAMSRISAGETVYAGHGWYLTTGALSFNGLQSRKLTCLGDNRQVADNAGVQLTLVASGSAASLVTMRSNAISDTVEGCALTYFDADYTGYLVDLGDPLLPSSTLRFPFDKFAGVAGVLKGASGSVYGGTQAGPAAGLVRLRGVYDVDFDHPLLLNAQAGIVGPADLFINANRVTIERPFCYGGMAGATCIEVAGQDWTITDIVAEPYNDGWTPTDATLAAGAISARTMTGFVANTSWAATTAFGLGQVLTDTNGNAQVVTHAGVSGATQPAWASSGSTTDGSVTWQEEPVGLPASVYDGLNIRGGTFEDAQLGNGTAIDLSTNGNGPDGNGTVIEGVQIAGGGYGVKPPAGTGFEMHGMTFRSLSNAWSLAASDRNGAALSGFEILGNAYVSASPGSTFTGVSAAAVGCAEEPDPYIAGHIAMKCFGTIQHDQENHLTASPYFPVAYTGQTASLASTSLTYFGNTAPQALYRVDWYVTVTGAGTTGATVAPSFGWQDSAQAETLTPTACAATALGDCAGSYVMRTDGVHNPSFSVTDTGGATYSFHLSVTRLP